MTWTLFDELKFFKSPEAQLVRLALEAREGEYNPKFGMIFRALFVPPNSVRVCIVGQDPYPNPKYCTGWAFSIPKECDVIPPTLMSMFREYCQDLKYPLPPNGDLSSWVDQGVMLWNAIPTCDKFKSLSHKAWPEWHSLTKEVVERLSKERIVFAFLGGVAREFAKYVSSDSKVIETSHPSPRGSIHSNHPFLGSRLFSTINSHLRVLDKGEINWRLDNGEVSKDGPGQSGSSASREAEMGRENSRSCEGHRRQD